ncbi:SBBP repeat-containing protein [Hymenobacter sp.]|uniref:SBBP repeat-containing protein n=1 Tax=Hymenobacter sp. TaxID=1898978 RepID=UPI002EDB9A2B
MKQTFTRLLPAAASLLLHMPTTQAQVPSPPAARKEVQLGPLQQLSLPAGALAGRPALPTAGGMVAKQLARQRSLAGARAKTAARTGGSQDQARTSTTETVTQAWVVQVPFSQADMVVDAAGNTYVTGTSNGDFLTIKYSPSGQELWRRSYNATLGSINGSEDARAIALDPAGNVIVTGSSIIFPSSGSSGTREDFVTIKYSPSGSVLWNARFNGGNFRDIPTDLTVDAAGNVYVVGTTQLTIGSSVGDVVAVKYSATGNQQWYTPYVNSGLRTPRTIAVDPAGDVYVLAGYISKYSGATGRSVGYNYLSNGNFTKLLVDAGGNVVATGTTGGGSDYYTAKFSSSGQRLWEARYNGPGNAQDAPADLALDGVGNVVVTGASSNGTSNDFATLKYDGASGQQLWLARYNSPNDVGDAATELVLDRAGNVYVTGASRSSAGDNDFNTVKYSPSGQQLWEIRYAGPNNSDDVAQVIGLDQAGNVYVSGLINLGNSNATVKYEQPSVQELWEARFTGTGSSAEVAKDVVSDAAGNVYVTGYAYNGRNYDYATVKYNASGQQQWQARYNGPADNEDLPTNVVVDAAGNVYVSGTSYSASESDYATVKYSPTGQQLWVARYNGPASGYDLAAKVRVDLAGNVLVTGSSDNGASSSYDYATIKYDANGQQQWATRYNGPANSFDLAADLVVDDSGNVYVTGTTYTDSQSDYATLKYDAAGQQQWAARYNGTGNGYDEAAKLGLTGVRQTGVVVTGTSDGGSSTGFDIATALYAGTTGQQQWVNRYNGPGNGDDVVADLVTGQRNNEYVYVAGTSFSSVGADYAIMSYYISGQPLWNIRYNGPANSYDEAKAVAVDAAGNAYVTGLSYNSDGTDDYATVKYAFNPNPNSTLQTGQQLWAARYDGAGSYDEAAAIAVDGSNNVYVTGYSLGTSTGYDFATLKYSQSNGGGPVAQTSAASSSVAASAPLAVAAPRKGQQELAVYPNPATGPTTLSFRPVLDGSAQVLVYNQLGQQVATLYAGTVHKGQHYELPLHSEKLALGLYTCSLLVNGQRETVRLLINR